MSEVIKKAATNEVVEFLYGDLRERSAPVIFNSATGNPVVFNDGANGLPVKSLKVNFSPIQNGSGDPSPENIRSIVPWNGLNIFGSGKNLFDENEYQHIYTDPDYVWDPVPYRCRYIQLSPNTTYTISSQIETTSDEIVLINNKQQPNIMPFFDLRNTSQTMTLKTDGTGRLYIGSVNGDDASAYNRIKECKIQIEVGSSATAYEPYHPITNTDIEFPSPVYGGTLDVVSGVITVEWQIRSMGGTSWDSFNRSTSYTHPFFYGGFIDRIKGRTTDFMADCFKKDTANVFGFNFGENAEDLSIAFSADVGSTNIYIRDDSCSTREEFLQKYVDRYIAYKLATPVEIQLTPVQLQSILGKNTFWSDANGNIEVEYRADTELFMKQNTIKDVQMNGMSINQNGIANIPLMTGSTVGVARTDTGFGTGMASNGSIVIVASTDTNIKAGTDSYRPIVAANQHKSVFYALAKLAGVDMAQSSNAVGTYTDSAKTAIQKMFGFDGILGDYELSTTASKAYAIGETFIFNGNRYRATTAIAINDVLAPGTNCVLDPLDGKYIRNTDYATSDVYGLVKIGEGLSINSNNGKLQTNSAGSSTVKQGRAGYAPIVPGHQHEAAFYGLAKAAGADMEYVTGDTVGVYPQAQKTAIQTMLGIEADIPLVETVTGATVSITGMPNVRYICDTAISELTITPPASGSIVVRFTAGSNCIVSLPQTVKLPAWFDISSLEDGTTYEIIITDGVYGGVMSWA